MHPKLFSKKRPRVAATQGGGRDSNIQYSTLRTLVTSGLFSLVLMSVLGCQHESKVVAPPATVVSQPAPVVVAAPVVEKAVVPQPSIHKIWQDTDEELVKDGVTFHMTIQRDLRSEGTQITCTKLSGISGDDASRTAEFNMKLAGGYSVKEDHLMSYRGEVTNSSAKVRGVETPVSELSEAGKVFFELMKDGLNKTEDFHVDKITEDTLILSEGGHTYLYRTIDESQLLLK